MGVESNCLQAGEEAYIERCRPNDEIIFKPSSPVGWVGFQGVAISNKTTILNSHKVLILIFFYIQLKDKNHGLYFINYATWRVNSFSLEKPKLKFLKHNNYSK